MFNKPESLQPEVAGETPPDKPRGSENEANKKEKLMSGEIIETRGRKFRILEGSEIEILTDKKTPLEKFYVFEEPFGIVASGNTKEEALRRALENTGN